MSKRAIILAGGRGTRLRPYTVALPKPLVPIGETPILEIIIKQLVQHGFDHITITVNHLADIITAFFGDGTKWGIKIDYSFEEKSLSTMGPLSLIKDLPENFIIMNGDVLSDISYSDFFDKHIKSGSLFTISSHIRKEKSDYGVLEVDKNSLLVDFHEKPEIERRVSMGIYAANKKILAYIPYNEKYGFDDLMHDMINKKAGPFVIDHPGYWLDIGRPDDYARACEDVEFLNGKKVVKIFVTGGSGFIGSNLIPALESRGHSVKCIDLITGHDMSQWDSIKDLTSFDVLIHLAGMTYVPVSYKTPGEMYRINISSTLNALELCKMNNAKMIFNSSYVYGHPRYLPIDENHPLEALNPYAQSKIIGEKLCESYAKDLKVPVRVFRIFNVYGRDQAKHFLIPKIIDQIKRDNRAFLEDPIPKRDYVHIDDLVRAYIHTLERFDSDYETLNIGSGQSFSVEEIGNTVLDCFPKGAKIHYSGKQRPNEVMDTKANIKKAEDLIDWKPLVPFKEGIAKLVKEELG